ncbi:type I restriction enzyme HsdR N-terminal domain-containing protein, partial [Candidatus Woesearchaeota archaeon]|nr:type I restriction enzyme HsdR N-terminal domain-containing protein [Candidatus Woesearchaeota archaeon]
MDRDKLKQTIEIASKKLKDYQSIYLKNEPAVRTQLINPILASLGWNIEDPSEVMIEDKNEEGRADYSLTKNNEKVLFIESKNLAEDVESYKNMSQLAKYAVSEGVDFGLLSNGKKWLLLRTYEKNTNLADRKLWVVDVLDEDIEKVVLRLKNISKENINNLNSLIKK